MVVEVWVPLEWVTVVVVVVVVLEEGCWLPVMAPMMDDKMPLANPPSPDSDEVEVEVTAAKVL